MKCSKWLAVVVLAGCNNSAQRECKDVEFIYDGKADTVACIEALTDRCRAYTTESECWAAEPIELGGKGLEHAYCAWTNVAVLGDTQTCEIAETFGRCEAAMSAPWDGPVNACADGMFFGYAPYTAFVDDLEIVDSYVTGPDGNPYDALLLWTGDSTAECFVTSVVPTTVAPPEWCSCAPAACQATGD